MDIIVIAVGIFFLESLTGGDIILIELTKRLISQGNHVNILTSKAGEKVFRGQGVDANFWIISEDEGISKVSLVRAIPTLLARMLKAGMELRKKNLSTGTILFASTDLFFDIFPMFFIRKREIKRILPFYVIQPNPFKGFKGTETNQLKMPNPRETAAYLQQRLSFWCFKHASDFVFSLSYLQHFLIDDGVLHNKIVGFMPGIAWELVKHSVAEDKKYDACFIGRYHPMRGCEDLVRIWELVYKKNSKAKLAIMGSAGRALEPLIKERHLENNIDILGFVDEGTKFKTMKESKIFLFPSYYYGAMVIDEAMACSLPVIAYNLSGYQDIYPKGMRKIIIGNQEAFALEILNLLADQDLRKKISKEALEVVSDRNWDKVYDEFIAGINTY
jgi:glycosyltransferase involved in cell wall biosynthesis